MMPVPTDWSLIRSKAPATPTFSRRSYTRKRRHAMRFVNKSSAHLYALERFRPHTAPFGMESIDADDLAPYQRPAEMTP